MLRDQALAANARDTRLWNGPGPWLLLTLVICNVVAGSHLAELKRDREANLLGLSNGSNRPDQPPRYDWSVGEDLARYLPAIPDARRQPLVIVLGMSQMYTINDVAQGDEAIPELLDEEFSAFGVRAFGLVAPNLNNEEALLLQLAALARPATTPRAFLYGVCFDKFRNIDLRPALARLLSSDLALQQSWTHVCEGRASMYPLACEKMRQSLATAQEPSTDRPDTVEQRIRTLAARALPLVDARSELNGALQYRVYLFRNWLFDIHPSTKRPIISSRYQLNQELLGLLEEVSRARGIQLMVFVNPLNPQAENPYITEQYQQFKAWLQGFAQSRRLGYANLEDAVPAEHWGQRSDGPDFKHFRGEGHRLTARAIDTSFRDQLRALPDPVPAP